MSKLNKTNAESFEIRQRMDEPSAATADPAWKSLYRVGGVAALITAVIFPIAIIVFVVWPPPFDGTVIDWFTLFQENVFLGLLSMDLFLIAYYVLTILAFLALYVALRQASESFMAIAITLGLVGIATYFASNTAFNMLSLSNQYAAASTDAQRTMFLAAGQAMLAIYQGTAFHMSYFLVSVAIIIISAVMLRNNIFGKVTAYVGILASIIGFGLYVPLIGDYIAIFSVVGLEIWYVLIAQRLFRLGQRVS